MLTSCGPLITVRPAAPWKRTDPVCGSGNISVAAFLRDGGQAARFGASYRSRQGMQLGRDGSVSIRIGGDGIHLGGQAVTCVEGALRVQ